MNSLPVIEKKNPKVSIGIPTFNRPEGLKRTLECLTNQSYTNIEIIISDNCSPTNEVSKIAAEFTNLDPRVKFYRQSENMGAAFNFKFVLQKAEGEYFMWAADDDWWDAKFVENIVFRIQQTPGAVAGFCNYIVVDEENPALPSPNALPYLLELNHTSDVTRLSSFINQYEGYGKANIFYSVIRSDIIKNIPFDLINEKVLLGSDLSMIYSWLSSGDIVICSDILRKTTIGNVKQNDQFITEFNNRRIDLLIMHIYIGKLKFYWNTWSDNLFFYFYLTRTAPIGFFTKSLLYLTISKKILLFMYDLVCYNVVLKGFNIFQFLKRKQSLAQ
jgi:glycosyltransferase involved in cell wall biosynthesis